MYYSCYYFKIKNANIVEHLVSDLKQNNSSLMESFIEPSQLDNELQRLQRKVEHLKVQNTVLSLTLDESKEHCEHLYLLCGKYESNAIALQAALNCSDRAIEAYDVMLALLESKLVCDHHFHLNKISKLLHLSDWVLSKKSHQQPKKVAKLSNRWPDIYSIVWKVKKIFVKIV